MEFRGIRLGTVAQVPFYTKGLDQKLDNDFRIPVLIHIEPERFAKDVGADFNLKNELKLAMKDGLRASLKSGNLLTGHCLLISTLCLMCLNIKGQLWWLVIKSSQRRAVA